MVSSLQFFGAALGFRRESPIERWAIRRFDIIMLHRVERMIKEDAGCLSAAFQERCAPDTIFPQPRRERARTVANLRYVTSLS